MSNQGQAAVPKRFVNRPLTDIAPKPLISQASVMDISRQYVNRANGLPIGYAPRDDLASPIAERAYDEAGGEKRKFATGAGNPPTQPPPFSPGVSAGISGWKFLREFGWWVRLRLEDWNFAAPDYDYLLRRERAVTAVGVVGLAVGVVVVSLLIGFWTAVLAGVLGLAGVRLSRRRLDLLGWGGGPPDRMTVGMRWRAFWAPIERARKAGVRREI